MTTEQYYNTNPDFKEFIDKSCRTGRYTVQECLGHKMSEEVMNYYMSKTPVVKEDK